MAATRMSAWRVISARLAHDIAAAADDHVGAGRVVAVTQQYLLDAGRGAGHEIGPALDQLANVERVQAIHVLGGVQRLDDQAFVDLERHWQLDQDPMETGVIVQCLHPGQDLFVC